MSRWPSHTKHVLENPRIMASRKSLSVLFGSRPFICSRFRFASLCTSRMLAGIVASSCDDSTRCLWADAFATTEESSCNDMVILIVLVITHNWHQLETLCLYTVKWTDLWALLLSYSKSLDFSRTCRSQTGPRFLLTRFPYQLPCTVHAFESGKGGARSTIPVSVQRHRV